MRSSLLAVVVLLLAPAVAGAQATITAGPPNQYLTPAVSIDQGGTVTFTNYDVPSHDVVARDKGPDGLPLFRSELVSLGGSTPVVGTDYLTTGGYEFFCSIHASMVGTLTVTAAGTPKPRPGPPPSPPPTPGPPPDTTAPNVKVELLDSSVAAVRRRRGLRVRVTTDENATVGLTAKAGSRRLALGNASITGTRTLTVRLTSSGVRAVRKAKRLRVALTATAFDAARNRVTVTASRSLGR